MGRKSWMAKTLQTLWIRKSKRGCWSWKKRRLTCLRRLSRMQMKIWIPTWMKRPKISPQKSYQKRKKLWLKVKFVDHKINLSSRAEHATEHAPWRAPRRIFRNLDWTLPNLADVHGLGLGRSGRGAWTNF